MTIKSAIFAGTSGLKVAAQSAEIISGNIANASTPGYVRRGLALGELMAGTSMAGVGSLGVTQAGDERFSAQRRQLSSDVAQADVLASAWKALSTRIGDQASGSGLFSRLSQFETNLSQAISAPESGTNLTALFNAAAYVAAELRSLSGFGVTARADADNDIAKGVREVNAALIRIQDINLRLVRAEPSSALSASLRDERQRLLDTVSQFLPVQTVERDAGTIDVLTREGVYLILGGAVKSLEFTPGASFGPDQTLASTALSGLSAGGINLTPGTPLHSSVSAGRFSALFTLRDQDLPLFLSQMDMVATDLISRFSANGLDPTKPAGAPGIFVDVTTPANPNPGQLGLASRITLNPLIDPAAGGEIRRLRDGLGSAVAGPPGNSAILKSLFAALTEIKSVNQNGVLGGFSVTGLAGELSSFAGRKRVGEESILASTRAQHLAMVEAEQKNTSVDVDKEMENLLLIEQAYAANARVIQVASEMLKTLMEI